jgi:signal transduction histidine kinase/ligand-binding sensor domain-containing protein
MNQSIVSLLGARDGTLWIGTGGDLAYLDGLDFGYREVGRVNDIAQDKNGQIWIARSRLRNLEDGPLCRVERDSLQCFGEAEGIGFGIQGAEALIDDRAGGLWIGSTKGICHWTGKSGVTYFPKALENAEGAGGVLALELDKDSSLLVGTGQRGPGVGLQRFHAGRWSDYNAGEIRGSEISVETMLRDREGGLWIATTDKGLLHVHNGLIDTFTQSDGLSSNSIQNLYEDREGNIWAVSPNGLDRFRELPVVTLGQSQGLSSEHVSSVFASSTGRMWVGNQSAVDSLWQGKISTIPKNKLPGKNTTSILEDRQGRLWLGMDAGLYVMEDGHFRAIRTPDGKSLGVVFGLVEGADNHIYAVVTGRPQRIFDILGIKVLRSDPLPALVPGSPFAAHPRGGIWLPRGDGALAHYHSGRFESSGQPFKMGFVLTLTDDQQGAVWGASVGGVVRWAGSDTGLLSTKNGLRCNTTYSLIFDSAGTLWVSSECGFMAITRAELQNWVAHPDAQIAVRTYDVMDGAETGDSPFGPTAAKSPDGRLWFVNEVALQIIDPVHLPENHLAPPVVIEEIEADGAKLSPGANVRLPARTRDLRIDYSGLSFTCPPKVRFRYKLEGRDQDWQDAGTRRQAFYTDLPPRSYRFRVIASNNDGVWNEAGAHLAFTIPPAFTQGIWFKAICLLGFAGCVYLAYRLRVRQVTGQLRARMCERIAERERIARDLHDTFFQGIQGLLLRFHTATSQLNRHEPARRIFEETLKQSDQVMLEGRELVWDLRATVSEQNDLPTAFADFGEGMRNGTSYDFKVVVNGAIRRLHPLVFEELFKIGKEALGNAFRHSGAYSIEAELSYERSELRLQIRDDGTGIDSAILRQGHRDGHFGLPGMRERAQKIGAHLDVWSGTGAGTEVEVRLAARVAYASEPNGSWLSKLRRLWQSTKREGSPDNNGHAAGYDQECTRPRA